MYYKYYNIIDWLLKLSWRRQGIVKQELNKWAPWDGKFNGSVGS